MNLDIVIGMVVELALALAGAEQVQPGIVFRKELRLLSLDLLMTDQIFLRGHTYRLPEDQSQVLAHPEPAICRATKKNGLVSIKRCRPDQLCRVLSA